MSTRELFCPSCGGPAESALWDGETKIVRCAFCGVGSAVDSAGERIPDDDFDFVGQQDDHTGVGASGGIPYTYEHVDSRPDRADDVYRVTTVIDFAHRPMHRNRYYLPAPLLNAYLRPSRTNLAEEIVDIRPMSFEAARAEMDDYRAPRAEPGEGGS